MLASPFGGRLGWLGLHRRLELQQRHRRLCELLSAQNNRGRQEMRSPRRRGVNASKGHQQRKNKGAHRKKLLSR